MLCRKFCLIASLFLTFDLLAVNGAEVTALENSVNDYAQTVQDQSDKVDRLKTQAENDQAQADSVDAGAKEAVYQPIADASREEHEREQGVLEDMQTELGNQRKALESARAQERMAQTAEDFATRMDPNASPLERWQAESRSIQNDVNAVNENRAAAGPELARSNDMHSGMQRVENQPNTWEFTSSDPKYDNATFRTTDRNYVSNQPLSGSDLNVNRDTWASLSAQPNGSTSGFQDFQGGVTSNGTIRADGTVRVGDTPFFSNGASQPGGFGFQPDGRMTVTNLGTDGRVFQATQVGGLRDASGTTIHNGLFTSGGQTYQRNPNGTYSLYTPPSNDVLDLSFFDPSRPFQATASARTVSGQTSNRGAGVISLRDCTLSENDGTVTCP